MTADEMRDSAIAAANRQLESAQQAIAAANAALGAARHVLRIAVELGRESVPSPAEPTDPFAHLTFEDPSPSGARNGRQEKASEHRRAR